MNSGTIAGAGEDPQARSGDAEIFYSLEGLRGFAAILIFLRHAVDYTGVKLPSSHLAVDLFFILSGFVLAHAYDGRFAAGLTARGFLRLRLIRLYPLYALSLAGAVATVVMWRLISGPGDWSAAHLGQALALNGLFLPAPTLYGEAYPLNLPAWSLFLELCACTAFATFWRWLTVPVLLAVIATSATVLIAVGVHYGTLSLGWDWRTFASGFARVFYSFPLGVLLYRTLRTRRALPLHAALAPLAAVVVLSMAAGSLQLVYELVCALVVLPLLVALGAKTRPGLRLARLFGFVGVTSYALYVLHVPALTFVGLTLSHLGLTPAQAGPGVAALLLVVLLAGCWAFDRFYDIPIRSWLKRATARPRPAPSPRGVAAVRTSPD